MEGWKIGMMGMARSRPVLLLRIVSIIPVFLHSVGEKVEWEGGKQEHHSY